MTHQHWPMKSIGDLFMIGAGKTMSAKAREGLHRRPFLRTSNVLWDEIDLSVVDEMAITDEELRDKSLAPGDLLVCEGGDIGRAAVWTGQREVMSFQNHLHRLRPKTNLTCSRFYVYFLQCGFTQLGIFDGAGNKTTIPNLSKNRLAGLDVLLPPIWEQQAITALLSKVRDGIGMHAEATRLATELKTASMNYLFTRGLRGEAQKETEIGWVPESWDVVRLGAVSELNTGTTPSTKEPLYYSGSIPFIKTGAIVNNRIRRANAFISDLAISDYALTKYPPGTILMAMYGQGKTRGQVSLLEIEASTTQNAAAIQPKGDIDSVFLWQYLKSCYERLRSMGSLGHISHLNLGYLRELLVVKPPLNEQKEIVLILDAIDRKIALHQQKRAVMEDLFKALLHKVMTGEIDVNDLNLQALSAHEPATEGSLA